MPRKKQTTPKENPTDAAPVQEAPSPAASSEGRGKEPAAQSSFKMFGATFNFTNEPASVRIALVAMVLVTVLLVIYLLQQYALPAVSLRGLVKVPLWNKLFQGKGPSP